MEMYTSLPNLLAGGLLAGALPGLALAADTTYARHTKEHSTCSRTPHKKRCMGMPGRRYERSHRDGGAAASWPPPISIAAVISPMHTHTSLFVWRECVVLFCVACLCCALLSAAGARPGSAFAGKPSQEIRQAMSFAGP